MLIELITTLDGKAVVMVSDEVLGVRSFRAVAELLPHLNHLTIENSVVNSKSVRCRESYEVLDTLQNVCSGGFLGYRAGGLSCGSVLRDGVEAWGAGSHAGPAHRLILFCLA
jgi:hypothetical protein